MLNQKKETLVFNLPIGYKIIGKWNKKSCRIQQFLGKGAIGAVYLVKQADGRLAALKISDQSSSLLSEINVLKKLAKAQGISPGPSLYEVDDWISSTGKSYLFYTMEYVQGEKLDTFLDKRGSDWLGVLFSQLLTELDLLHQEGFVLGDLKLDNVIVAKNPTHLRFIDVGGVTAFGRSVKEYTDFYDRGYWQCGDRRADVKYDLFSLAMMALHYAYPKQFKKTKDPKKDLLAHLKESEILQPYRVILEGALFGQYKSSLEMKRDFKKIGLRQMRRNQKVTLNQSQPQQTSHEISWLEIIIFFSCSAILLVTTFLL